MGKGIAVLQWVFISLVLTLVIVTVAVMQLRGTVYGRIMTDARYQALEASSIINILQASPIETTQTYSPPLCVEIVDHSVKVEDHTVELITSPVEVEPGTIGCDEDGKYIVREDKIRIKTD